MIYDPNPIRVYIQNIILKNENLRKMYFNNVYYDERWGLYMKHTFNSLDRIFTNTDE